MKLMALAALALAAAAQPAMAQTEPEQTAAMIAACGGDIQSDEVEKLGKQKVHERLACFTRVIAANFNKTLPKKLDDVTTLDHVSAEGTILTYQYSVSLARTQLPANASELLGAGVRKNVCESEDMRATMRFGGVYRYRWFDRDKGLIAETVITGCDK